MMTTANDARKAHKILDDLFKGKMVLDEEREFLRSALPEPPKQKTLEEIIERVYDAWMRTNCNEWAGNIDNPDILIEEWLVELHVHLKGLMDTPVAVPTLPAGMRIADHEDFGRVVTSPKPDQDGVYVLLVPRPKVVTGADWEYAHECELTFIDAEPTHPEFLETVEDYEGAPEGTIVVADGGVPCHKFQSKWSSVAFLAMKDDRGMSRARRRVLRWGK